MVYGARRLLVWCFAPGFVLVGIEGAAMAPPGSTWIEKLRGDDVDGKMRAARELALTGSAAAVRPLLDAIRAVGNTQGPIDRMEEACGLAVRAIFFRDPDGTVEAFRKAFGDDDPVVRRIACEAAGWWIGRRAGARAEAFGPELVRLYEKDRDPEVRRAALVAIWRMGIPGTPAILAKATRDHDSAVRSAAFTGVYWLGPEASAATEALLEVLRDEEAYQFHAGMALGRIGASALPGLMKICEERKGSVHGAALALAEMGPAAGPAAPLLTQLLEKKGLDLQEKKQVIRALGAIGGQALPALPVLETVALGSDRNWIENLVFEATSRIVRDALRRSGALDEGCTTKRLLELLADGEHHERWGAAELLGDGKYQPADVVAARLAEAVKDRTEDLFVRRSAAVSLGRLGPTAPEVVSSLARTMCDRCVHVFLRRAAAEALGSVDKDGQALGALLRVFEDRHDDGDLRWAAIRSVGAIGQKALPALDRLLSIVGDRAYRWVDRREALHAIKRLGPAAENAIPKFVALIGDASEDEGLRWAAADSLPSLGASGVDRILGLLSRDDPKTKRIALFALRGYWSAASGALPAVERLLSDADADVREGARRAIAAIRGATERRAQKDKR